MLYRDADGVGWYTTSDVAQIYKCTRHTILLWCKRGYFPHAKRIPAGRHVWLIPDTDFDASLTRWRRGIPRPNPEEVSK